MYSENFAPGVCRIAERGGRRRLRSAALSVLSVEQLLPAG